MQQSIRGAFKQTKPCLEFIRITTIQESFSSSPPFHELSDSVVNKNHAH